MVDDGWMTFPAGAEVEASQGDRWSVRGRPTETIRLRVLGTKDPLPAGPVAMVMRPGAVSSVWGVVMQVSPLADVVLVVRMGEAL